MTLLDGGAPKSLAQARLWSLDILLVPRLATKCFPQIFAGPGGAA
jgi:hypothetical protein